MRGVGAGSAGATIGRPVGVIVWIVWIITVLVAGCDGDETPDASQLEPYQIAAVEISDDNGEQQPRPAWSPGDTDVTRWVEAALHDSHRGISRRDDGMEMRVVFHHRIDLEQVRGGHRLVVGVDAQAERQVVDNDSPMVTLTGRAKYGHFFAENRDTQDLLNAMSRTLLRQAIDDVVDQLRLRARVRQLDASRLVDWIDNDELRASVRHYAIRRALIYTPDGLEDTLKKAVEQSDDEMAVYAARALFELDSDRAAHALMEVAQRLSRDKKYDEYMELLPLLGKVDAPWVAIYLKTVADAHRIPRVRRQASAVLSGGES